MLKPGVREDAVQPTEDVDEVLNPGILTVGIVEDGEAAGEELLVGDDVGGPVESVAAVVDGAAALGLLVDGAEELPLGGAHLGTRAGATGRRVEEEADDERVALRDEEATELVEPDGAVDARRGLSELQRGCACEGLCGEGRVVEVQRGEVLLELEGRLELDTTLVAVKRRQKAAADLVQGHQRRPGSHIRSLGARVYPPLRVRIQERLLHGGGLESGSRAARRRIRPYLNLGGRRRARQTGRTRRQRHVGWLQSGRG